MKINELWLREWIDTDLDIETIGHKLTMAGLELDSLDPVAGSFDNVVVGEILSLEKHPDADKLNICRVSTGGDNVSRVVCGAPNAREGLKTAFAMVGASLPGFKIKKAKLRGVESFGMLCSAKELALDEDADGIIELPDDAPVGQDVRKYLQLEDSIMELDLTPNRADCLSVSGVARDLAAITKSSFNEISIPEVEPTISSKLDVVVEAIEDCPRYTARVIEGVNPAANTPVWMKEKLRRCGIRSISPGVDITNYVLLELGQPMHAFDLDKLNGGIIVRIAATNEKLTLLDEKEVELVKGSLVIADDSGPLALAGIMGGLESSVTAKTTNILLESACFSAAKIAGRARCYGLHTESSHRFERGVDPQLQLRAMERATQLVIEICGGNPGPVINIDNIKHYQNNEVIQIETSEISGKLGVVISASEIAEMFTRLGCNVTLKADKFSVTPPSWRYDLRIAEDLIEEVARLYGYDNIPLVTSSFKRPISAIPECKITTSSLQQVMLALGYQEAITYSFIDLKTENIMQTGFEPTALENPISTDLAVMRTTLLGGLIQAVANNQRRQLYDMQLFETGLVFQQQNNQLQQVGKIAGVITGVTGRNAWNQAEKPLDFFDLKGDVEALLALSSETIQWQQGASELFHPGQSASLIFNGELIGYVGAIHPEKKTKLGVKHNLLAFEIDISHLGQSKLPIFQPLSKFPAVRRDLSILVNKDISYRQIQNCVAAMDEELITNLRVFDLYSGEGVKKGLKSIAFSLILQDFSRTLEEDQIDELVIRVADRLQQKFGATLRE